MNCSYLKKKIWPSFLLPWGQFDMLRATFFLPCNRIHPMRSHVWLKKQFLPWSNSKKKFVTKTTPPTRENNKIYGILVTLMPDLRATMRSTCRQATEVSPCCQRLPLNGALNLRALDLRTWFSLYTLLTTTGWKTKPWKCWKSRHSHETFEKEKKEKEVSASNLSGEEYPYFGTRSFRKMVQNQHEFMVYFSCFRHMCNVGALKVITQKSGQGQVIYNSQFCLPLVAPDPRVLQWQKWRHFREIMWQTANLFCCDGPHFSSRSDKHPMNSCWHWAKTIKSCFEKKLF